MKIIALIFSFFCFTSVAVAQSLGTGSVAAYPKDMVSFIVDEQGETYVKIMNYTCVITAEKSFASAKEKLKWDKLKYDVKKAYPYAVMAKLKLAEMDAQIYEPKINPDQFLFSMIDNKGVIKHVVLHKSKPQDFEKSEQIVLIGKMKGDDFHANDILMKCPSKYSEGKPQIN